MRKMVVWYFNCHLGIPSTLAAVRPSAFVTKEEGNLDTSMLGYAPQLGRGSMINHGYN